jgi:glycosyl transferase, family 25
MSAVLDAEAASPPRTDQQLRIAVFVVSLPDAEKRRSVIAEYLSRVNLPWSFFDGFRYNPKCRPDPNKIEIHDELSTGQVGCFLSHRALWKEIGNSRLDYAIVLEDDTVLIPSLDFFALFSLLSQLGLSYIRLTTHHIDKAKTLIELGYLYGLVCRIIRPKYGLGTGAYALTPEAARQLYASAVCIDNPIDLWLERYSNHGIAIYNLFPAPAIEIRTQSTIQVPAPNRDGFIAYVIRKITRGVLEGLDQWKLSKLDDALRKRADLLYPGMAVWPRSELRKYVRRLLRVARVS